MELQNKNEEKLQNERNGNQDKLFRISWQIFVSWVINMHANGSNAAMTGLVIAGLKEPTSDVKMTPNEESWFATMFMIGMATGTPICGIQSRILGRKKTIMITHVVSFCGALCILFADTAEVFYLGNFLSGYTNAVSRGIGPIYTSEVCQPTIRKFTGGFVSVQFYVGYGVAYFTGSLSHWKTAAIVQTAWPCLVFMLMFLCPESPTWLVSKSKKEEALRVLTNLRGKSYIAVMELTRIEDNFKKQKDVTAAFGQVSIWKRQYQMMRQGTFVRPCLVLTILMTFCWQWTGGQFVVLHLVEILGDFEVPIQSDWASAGLGLYQLLCGLAGILVSLLVSRRTYYISSGICIFLGTAILATLIHLKKYDMFLEILRTSPDINWISFVGLLIYFTGYSMGWVSVCFMLIGELLPSNGREIGSFIAMECSNVSAIILLKFVSEIRLYLGMDGLFCLFSCVSIFAIVFAYFCIPDTFGKTLEDIEEHYRNICYGTSKGIRGKRQVTTVINKGFSLD